MAGKIDYKQKYQELKAMFMSSVDSAWQDGYQHGLQDQQVEQSNQQQAEADKMAMAANDQPPQLGQEEQPEGSEQDSQVTTSQNPNGDELDQHISKLESMLGKGELASTDLCDLKKTLADIRSLQVQINLTKSLASIKNIKLAPLKKSISFSPKVQANLPEPAKKALNLQEQIVANVFKKWETDEKRAASDITSILNVEGITKKD